MSSAAHCTLLRILPISLALYAIALLTSMAGMEIFGWISATLALALWVCCDRRRHSLLWLKSDFALLALLLVIGLGAWLRGSSYQNPWLTLGAARWILLYFLIRYALRAIWNDHTAQKIFPWLFGLVALTGLYALFQHFSGVDLVREGHRAVQPYGDVFRASGFFSAPMTYGNSAGLSFFVMGGFLFARVSIYPRWRILLFGIGTSVGIYACYQRAVWMAFLITLLGLLIYSPKRIRYSVWGSLGLVAAALYATSPMFRLRWLSAYLDLTNDSGGRFAIWKANWQMFLDHPLIGVGYGINENMIGAYYERLGYVNEHIGHAHNNFIQFLSGTGAIGTFCFAFFIGSSAALCHRLYKQLPASQSWARHFSLGCLASLVFLMLAGIFECNFKDAEVNHQFITLLAVVGVFATRLETQRSPQKDNAPSFAFTGP